eukprot:scaffold4773_cov161-Skeletonema_dohrnii-CCMP3373.AAC.1
MDQLKQWGRMKLSPKFHFQEDHVDALLEELTLSQRLLVVTPTSKAERIVPLEVVVDYDEILESPLGSEVHP